MVAAVTEELKNNMEVQKVHTVEVLVPMRNLCDSPNYGCKYYHMVNSSIGFYSPSWTYIHLGSPLPHADRIVPLPLDSNSTLIKKLYPTGTRTPATRTKQTPNKEKKTTLPKRGKVS